MGTSEQVVQVDAEGDVMHVVMSRPPANALGAPLIDGLESAIDALERGGAKALVVSSAAPGFSAAGAPARPRLLRGRRRQQVHADARFVGVRALPRCASLATRAPGGLQAPIDLR